ncbi:helix-turn-helix domain-containing protein [Nocardia sp. SC052]|uniref:helix-turn-helix domain-containing protein n=1 Tax=Nocardia sichangensis TaxID=3385975 RepID=UPI0039A02FD7
MDFIGGYSRKDYLRDRLAGLKDRLASTPPREPEPVASKPHRLAGRLTEAMREEIVAKYEAGVPSTKLVREYGIGKGTVLKILREGGAAMRNQGLSDEQVGEAARLYESGLSLARIGERFGVDSTTVHRVLVGRDVRMRDTHGRER